MSGSLLAVGERLRARSEGPLSPQPPAPRLPRLPGQVVAARPAPWLLCGSVFLPDIWVLQRQACCLVTRARRSPAWPGTQLAIRDCDEILTKLPADCTVGLPPGEWSLDTVWDADGLWSRVGSHRSDSSVTGRFLLVCVQGPCLQGLFRKALLSAGEWGCSLDPGARSQGHRGPCRKLLLRVVSGPTLSSQGPHLQE